MEGGKRWNESPEGGGEEGRKKGGKGIEREKEREGRYEEIKSLEILEPSYLV